jgi:hypothetical protein
LALPAAGDTVGGGLPIGPLSLTREQELPIAVATRLLVGTLEVEVEALADGRVALAPIPEAVPDLQPEVPEGRVTTG